MPLFRHHALLLAHDDLTSAPVLGPAYRIRPSDGDTLPDRHQHWYVMFDLLREGEGVATAVVSTSFDGLLWHPIAKVHTKRSAHLVDFVELPALAPLLRVETALEGDEKLPQHRIVARLASDGPFTVQRG